MFTTLLFWRPDDINPAPRTHETEQAARVYAHQRAQEVQGRCEVHQGQKVIARYGWTPERDEEGNIKTEPLIDHFGRPQLASNGKALSRTVVTCADLLALPQTV